MLRKTIVPVPRWMSSLKVNVMLVSTPTATADALGEKVTALGGVVSMRDAAV